MAPAIALELSTLPAIREATRAGFMTQTLGDRASLDGPEPFGMGEVFVGSVAPGARYCSHISRATNRHSQGLALLLEQFHG